MIILVWSKPCFWVGYVISKIQFVLESKTTRELVQICSMHGCYLVTLKLIIIFGMVSNFITLFVVLTPFANVFVFERVCMCLSVCVCVCSCACVCVSVCANKFQFVFFMLKVLVNGVWKVGVNFIAFRS